MSVSKVVGIPRRLKLGFVGCGDVAGYTALFARLNRGIFLSACCDTNPEAVHRFALRNRISHTFTDYVTMLKETELDAVYLATPHDLHLPMTAQAVEAGLAVLCEKPLAATLEQGRQMVELVERSKAKVAVNYQYRYDNACYGLAQAARAGKMGDMLYGRVNLPWHRQMDYFTRSAAWHASLERSGGGTLLTQGSHFLDILLWAMNSQPVTAQGFTARRRFKEVEVEDLAMGQVELENGALIEITSSMVAVPEQSVTIELYGENGTAVFRERHVPRLRFQGLRLLPAKPPVPGLHALGRSLEAFRRWVIEDQPGLNPVSEAYRTLAVVDAIYRSARSGKREQVEELIWKH